MSHGQGLQTALLERGFDEGSESAFRHQDHQTLLADLFDDRLLNDCYQQFLDGQIHDGMVDLEKGLTERRDNSSQHEWREYSQLCMTHPIRKLVHEDPFTAHAFDKPRGYAGDAGLMDIIYRTEREPGPPPGTRKVGREIFRYTTQTAACEGVRTRARKMAELVDRLAMEKDLPHVLSVASGHMREADLSGALKQKRLGRWVAFDADVESLQETKRCYGAYGVETVGGTVRQMLSGKRDLGQFDLIYSTGLYDYLRESTGKRLTKRLFNMLRPGGHLLVANFLVGIIQRGYMESFMDWHLIYRNHSQMLELAMGIDQPKVQEIRLWAEEGQHILFLHIIKR